MTAVATHSPTDSSPPSTTNLNRYVAKCRKDENWLPGSIVPHEALQIEPASTVLNYGG